MATGEANFRMPMIEEQGTGNWMMNGMVTLTPDNRDMFVKNKDGREFFRV